ncbi:SDR family NAD(P)-dependent oxidoreductase [Pseudomaricurvus alkylphenolicus]|uniref:SDR family NAD(P)-dependent oxidoreductase n=1 Tax=Pseudomaricurvus alkylphenolicus TaxID=1306991 RepID=UPI00141F3B42|nr:SDR family NAD(P)-dependent oxidoreductase [Pseudomaricurvus alkylphenolicus]NIB38883.1 SDR family NAD(P)-dependent oxidoreductase [Pseudomaricurvus alkylphenolicus]
MRKTILVIGATGGVGQATCRLLSDRGHRVIATCRSQEQKWQLETEKLCSYAVPMNLSSQHSMELAFETLENLAVQRLDGLINCAAITRPVPLEQMTGEDLKQIFQINVFSALTTVQLALPLLRQCSKSRFDRPGKIIMVGSTGSDVVLPLLGAYSATKFALDAICDALRRELDEDGIEVSLIKPGSIKTPMMDNHLQDIDTVLENNASDDAQRYRRQYESHKKLMTLGYQQGVSAEQVAEVIIKAFDARRPKARYPVGLAPKLLSGFATLAPDALQDKLFQKL